MDERRAGIVVLVASLVALGAGLGAFGYWKYRENETRVFGDAPSVAPLWLLAGVAAIAVLVVLALVLARLLTPSEQAG